MKKYKVKQPVMLGFLTFRDSYDATIHPDDNCLLECDGKTIWVIKGDKRQESHTMANAIDIWLEQGKLEEVGL